MRNQYAEQMARNWIPISSFTLIRTGKRMKMSTKQKGNEAGRKG